MIVVKIILLTRSRTTGCNCADQQDTSKKDDYHLFLHGCRVTVVREISVVAEDNEHVACYVGRLASIYMHSHSLWCLLSMLY